ncbi:MAG: hypothetical protein ACYC19_00335 [Acidimicrobiales bacterium]
MKRRVSVHAVHGLFMASSTTSTLFNVHRGQALPAARAVVVFVPLMALLFYWSVVRRRRK